MKVRYLGHPDAGEDAPRRVNHHGLTFPKGDWVGVPDAVAEAISAKANPAFEVAEGDAPAANADVVMPGAAKGDAAVSKAAVMNRLDALGVTYDAKMGLPKLRALLEDAEFEHGEA